MAMTTDLVPTHAVPEDQIFLEGMTFYGYHGVNPEERILGQRFTVDVALTVDLRRAGSSDDLHDTVSYSDLYKRVRQIVEGEPRNLIETVAETIAASVLASYAAVSHVSVTVRKPAAPLKGAVLDAAGVRIVRGRHDRSAPP